MKNRFPAMALLATGVVAILTLGPPMPNHPLPAFAVTAGPLYEGDDWKKEFDEVSSKTQDAMEMTPDELSALAARCDALKPVVEKLDEHSRKVYLKRLEMTRKMFLFVLEYKKGQPP